MATYAELQTNVARNLSRSDLTSDIQLAIKRAIKRYERESFWFTENKGSFVTVSGTQNYTISATVGYLSINQVIMNYNGSRYEVIPTNYYDLNAMDAQYPASLPQRWAETMGMLTFYPLPNGSYTVSYEYSPKFTDLSLTSDSNAMTINAEDLIEARATWWVASRVMRNYELAAAAKSDETEALNGLRHETAVKTGSGKITPSRF